MLRSVFKGAIVLVFTTIGGYYILIAWQSVTAPSPQPVTLDFNNVRGCDMGKLIEIRDRQIGKDIPLANGADSLTICDDQSLQAVRTELPRTLANKIPGCLVFRDKSDGLFLVRKSDAVCALPDGRGFVCNAANARHPLGNNAVGDLMDEIKPCTADLLRRFGFPS